jgi:hypothetical protein
VASIRRWHPDVPISLIKDLHHGAYDTRDLERYWDVSLAPMENSDSGWGMTKFEPMFARTGERIALLDSDVIFRGPILDEWARFDEDLLVDDHQQPEVNVELYYFDRKRLLAMDPAFVYPGFVFNGGTLVVTAGVFDRSEFEPFIDFTPPPKVRDPLTFFCGDQGVVNYVVSKRVQHGRLKLRRVPMQHWAGYVPPLSRRLRGDRARAPLLDRRTLHYAGQKKTLFSANPNSHLLHHWEAEYYSRLPGGKARRRRDRLRRVIDVVSKREPWIQYV